MKRLFVLLLSIGGFYFSDAQSVHHFTAGFIVPSGSRYGREAIYIDKLAWQLYSSQLPEPKDGKIWDITAAGDTLFWRAIQADSANRFLTRRWEPLATGNTFGNPNRIDRGTGYIYLSYTARKEQVALLNIKGNSGFYLNGVPHTGDPYSSGYLYIPVQLKKGLNELYVRGTNITANVLFPEKPVSLMKEDLTMPSIVVGGTNTHLQGAIVVVNTTKQELKALQLKAAMNGVEITTVLPPIPAMCTRKVPFGFNASRSTEKGWKSCQISLAKRGELLDSTTVLVEAVPAGAQYSNTFVSEIDGSLQYYAVTPQTGETVDNSALFLSVHGAGVEALGQARAYQSKSWGTLVAATNRRPRGFNWEDWGRLDALEVLALAKDKFKPNPQRIYLTGHSMGGHGTWFLGATYPDQWAAIAPCAGYPTLKGYGSADGLVPDNGASPMESILLRAGNQSDIPRLASNYKTMGVYILHGSEDEVVPVKYARQMRGILGEFHPDMSYYEYPGGGHWFGSESVDWNPLFEFFKWHRRLDDSAADKVDFITANPGISASCRWATIYQQQHPIQYSHIRLNRNQSKAGITGNTDNVKFLLLSLTHWKKGTLLSIALDGTDTIRYTTQSDSDSIFLLRQQGKWQPGVSPGLWAKGPHRYGTFKEPFHHRMVFVYGTTGAPEENAWSVNKAKYDAETWYYRGNGAVDLVADKVFVPDAYDGRGIILYGNASTNSAWNKLLTDCPIQVSRNEIKAGAYSWKGDSLAAYFVWPLKNSPLASIGVVTGTGMKGMNAANANQYFAGASGFTDFMIFDLSMLRDGSKGVKMAGFYNNEWQLDPDEFIKE